MKLLNFEVDKQSIKRTDLESVVSLAKNYFKAAFKFKSLEWDGINKTCNIQTFYN